jgi:hypothetical protein
MALERHGAALSMTDQTNTPDPSPTPEPRPGSAQRLTESTAADAARPSRVGLLRALPLTLLPALLSCNADGTTPTLLDSEARVQEDGKPVSAELARLRKLQEVTWTVDDGTGPVAHEGPASEMIPLLFETCGALTGDAVPAGHPCDMGENGINIGSECGFIACTYTYFKLCSAHRLLEIADSLHDVGYSFTDTTETHQKVTIPPQSAPARADLRKLATQQAKDALGSSLKQLLEAHGSTSCAESSESVGNDITRSLEFGYNGQTVGGFITQQAIDSLNVYREAAKSAAYEVVNYAETFRSHPTQSEAVRNSMAGEELSRAEAVHLLIGGEPGLDGHPGLCTHPNLTPTEQAISEVLIDEGICPADFQGEISPAVIEAAIQAADAKGIAASLQEVLNTTQALGQQATALGVSTTASYTDTEGNTVFTGLQQPNNIDPMYYAAIGRYYQDDSVHRSDGGSATEMPTVDDLYTATNYVDVVDIAGQFISQLHGRAWPAGLQSSVAGPLALELAVVDSERLGRMKLCIVDNSSYYPGRVVVWGYKTADRLLVVKGEDGLKCAVDGRIDGTSCQLFAQTGSETVYNPALVLTELDESFNAAGSGFESAVSGDIFFTGAPKGERAYLVRPKSDQIAEAPGNYEAIAAGTFFEEPGCDVVPVVPEVTREAAEWLRPNSDWCTLPAEECDGTFFDDKLPLEDELSDDGDGVENSWKHYLALAKQAADEADLLGQQVVDEGLALDSRDEELELRKHNQDVEAIRELDELQSICGTDVDPYALLNKMGTGCGVFDNLGDFCDGTSDCNSGSCLRGRCTDAGNWLLYFASCIGSEDQVGEPFCTADADCEDDETCILGDVHSACFKDAAIDRALGGGDLSEVVKDNCGTDEACDDGYICRSGKCTLSPAKATETWANEPEIGRLNACLGEGDTVVPAVAVGGAPLCYWFHPSAPNDICVTPEGYSEGGSCPEVAESLNADGSPNCTATLNLPAPPSGGTPLQIGWTEANLGYFTTEDTEPPPSVEACDALRAWRASPSQETLSLALKKGFNGAGISAVVPRLSWREELDGHSAITLDGKPWSQFTTGNVYSGPSSVGICQATPNCSHSILKCGGGCDANRLTTGKRMRDAVLALRFGHLWEGSLNGWSVDWGFAQIQQFTFNQFSPGSYVGKRKVLGAGEGETRYVYQYQYQPQIAQPYSGPIDTFVWNTEEIEGTFIPQEYSTTITPPGFFDVSVLREARRSTITVTAQHPKRDVRVDDWAVVSTGEPYDGLMHSDRACGTSGDDARCWLTSYIYRRTALPTTPETEEFPEWKIGAGHVFTQGVTAQALLDGLEIACEAVVETEAPYLSRLDLADLPDIEGAGDLDLVAAYLEKLAQRVSVSGSQMILNRVPKAAVDALRDSGSSGAFPHLGGQYASAVSNLRGALVRLSDLTPQLAAQIRQLRYDIDAVQTRLAILNNEQQQARIEHDQAVANNITNCAAASASSVQFSFNAFGAAAAAMATCVNGAYQSELSGDLLELRGQSGELQGQLLFAEFRGQFDARAEAMREVSKGLSEAVETIDAQLAALENLRLAARRKLSTALQLSSYQATSARTVNSVLRSRFTTTRERYLSAFGYARKMSILARRSIETRLGMYLADMKEDLPLVDAPAGWASDVCTAVGIDYNSLRDDGEPASYSAQFIGNYVRKLEAVVESYRLAHNFHEGTDTGIVSLRDDILGIADECPFPTRNLLYAAENLQLRDSAESGTPGWTVQNCPIDASGTVSFCLSTEELSTESPLEAGHPLTNSTRGYRVTFGATPTQSNPNPNCPGCNPTPTTRLEQTLELSARAYQLAWYARKASTIPGAPNGAKSVAAFRNGSKISTAAPHVIQLEDGWSRYYVDFLMDATDQVSIAVVPEPSAGGAVSSQQVDIGAISLEPAAYLDGDLAPPASFEPTGLTRTREVTVCQDTDGDKFRTDWRRRCLTLCNNGFGTDCPQTDAKEYCFMETSFDLSQKQIELGNQLTQSGFARGNFNYRIEDIAVNFVGTDLRSCENSDLPQTCFSAGFIPYSLIHTGKYTVRNHMGESFDAKLYEGNIEHARGLATERYLSNPLSDADSSLLSQYMRGEFKGRPLDGQFVIRVWEDDQFSFEKIQDVQLVLKYRYWTRFN